MDKWTHLPVAISQRPISMEWPWRTLQCIPCRRTFSLHLGPLKPGWTSTWCWVRYSALSPIRLGWKDSSKPIHVLLNGVMPVSGWTCYRLYFKGGKDRSYYSTMDKKLQHRLSLLLTKNSKHHLVTKALVRPPMWAKHSIPKLCLLVLHLHQL
jgi:hypothetical protein